MVSQRKVSGRKEMCVSGVGGGSMVQNILCKGEANLSESIAVLDVPKRENDDFILSLSCVTLGCSWRERSKEEGRMRKKAVVEFKCSMCKRELGLGKTTGAMVRIGFVDGERVLCERCCNILTDVMAFGPKVLAEAFQWELRSRLLRASVVHEQLVCGQCLQRRSSHMFVKARMSNKRLNGVETKDVSLRRCSKCVYAFVDSMETMGVWREEFPRTRQ